MIKNFESFINDDETDYFKLASNKLREAFGKPLSNNDWSVTTWLIYEEDDNVGYFICDDEDGNFTLVKRIYDETTDENEIIDLKTLPYENIDELIQYVKEKKFK